MAFLFDEHEDERSSPPEVSHVHAEQEQPMLRPGAGSSDSKNKL